MQIRVGNGYDMHRLVPHRKLIIGGVSLQHPEGLGLDGLFKSGGIFPDFEEKLSIQKDYSLGFIRKTPENGFNEISADKVCFLHVQKSPV